MLGWFSADPSYILNGQDVYMSCLDGLVQTHLISEMAKMSTCHASMVWCTPILHHKCPRCLHVMLRWFSADPSYIFNGQDVYMSCLDGLVQTHLISEMAKMCTCHASMVWCTPILHLKWPRCLHGMLGWFSADPSYILNSQDVYMPCLDCLVQTHLIS